MSPIAFPFSLRRRRLLAGMAALAAGRHADAQPASQTALTLIVPAPPGNASDLVGRLIADALSGILAVPVRVRNVEGKGGVTGTNAMAAAPRDGSVLGLTDSSSLVAGKLLSRSAQFSPIEDFDWLAILGSYPNAMVLSTRSNHTTVEEWLEAARTADPPRKYGTYGIGTAGHLAGAYLRLEQNARITHVALDDADVGYEMLAQGDLDILFDGLPSAAVKLPRTGQRIIAVTSALRVDSLPDVPSFGELWHQSFEDWLGLVLPKGSPAMYSQIASAVAVLLAEARYAQGMRGAGLNFLGLSGSAARAYVEADFLRSAKLIARLNDEGRRQ
jgi:tripartite-type tricarboxylate transporter receptor subunit TctC